MKRWRISTSELTKREFEVTLPKGFPAVTVPTSHDLGRVYNLD